MIEVPTRWGPVDVPVMQSAIHIFGALESAASGTWVSLHGEHQ